MSKNGIRNMGADKMTKCSPRLARQGNTCTHTRTRTHTPSRNLPRGRARCLHGRTGSLWWSCHQTLKTSTVSRRRGYNKPCQQQQQHLGRSEFMSVSADPVRFPGEESSSRWVIRCTDAPHPGTGSRCKHTSVSVATPLPSLSHRSVQAVTLNNESTLCT